MAINSAKWNEQRSTQLFDSSKETTLLLETPLQNNIPNITYPSYSRNSKPYYSDQQGFSSS